MEAVNFIVYRGKLRCLRNENLDLGPSLQPQVITQNACRELRSFPNWAVLLLAADVTRWRVLAPMAFPLSIVNWS